MQHKNFMNWLLAFFLAKHIECFTQYGSCPDKYNIVLQELYGYPLYFKLPRNEYNAKFSIFPDVAQVNLYRRLPSTIIANIQLRKAIGIVKSNVVDEQGVVLGIADNRSNLPVLEGEFNLAALQILTEISNLTSQSVQGNLQDQTLTVRLGNAVSVLIDLQKTRTAWYSPLQAILNRSKIDGKIPQKIDLRFTSPVVTY